MKPFDTEAEMMAAFAPYWQDRGWELYAEVPVPARPGAPNETRADMVAIMGVKTRVFSGKLLPCLTALSQAYSYRGNAHHVAVVVSALPKPRIVHVHSGLGVGLYTVTPSGHVRCLVTPRPRQPVDTVAQYVARGTAWDDGVAAGSPGGAANRDRKPWEDTRDLVVGYVREGQNGTQGVWVREIAQCVAHHWRNNEVAERRIIELARQGVFPIRRLGGSGKVRFVVADDA